MMCNLILFIFKVFRILCISYLYNFSTKDIIVSIEPVLNIPHTKLKLLQNK